jgi:hypothetical protein
MGINADSGNRCAGELFVIVKRKEGPMLKLFTTPKPSKAIVESFNQTRGICPAPLGTKEYLD